MLPAGAGEGIGHARATQTGWHGQGELVLPFHRVVALLSEPSNMPTALLANENYLVFFCCCCFPTEKKHFIPLLVLLLRNNIALGGGLYLVSSRVSHCSLLDRSSKIEVDADIYIYILKYEIAGYFCSTDDDLFFIILTKRCVVPPSVSQKMRGKERCSCSTNRKIIAMSC